MKVFYIDIDEFKKQRDKSFFDKYNDINLTNEKRFYEYTIGRYLVKSVAKTIYNLENTDIMVNESNKPVFKDNKLYFNISHSKNIVIACFDVNPCGIDIEFIKERNISKFSDYYGQNFKDLEDFYKFWTLKEAKYKLDCNNKDSYFTKFLDKFYLTIVSSDKIELEMIDKYI